MRSGGEMTAGDRLVRLKRILPAPIRRLVCETSVPSWYDGVGHMPFLEAAGRFDRELSEFVDRARA